MRMLIRPLIQQCLALALFQSALILLPGTRAMAGGTGTATVVASITPATPSHFGQTLILPSVTLTSAGGPTPTGNISVFETTSGTDAPIAGLINVAATSVSNANLGFRSVGTHVFRIDYLGDANYAASSLTLTQVVDPAVTTATITSSSSGSSPSGTATSGTGVTLTITVSAASGGFPPIGTLQIRDNTTNTVLGTAIPDSPATSGVNTRNYRIFVNAALIAAFGTHNLTAVYTSGSGNFANHTSANFALNVVGAIVVAALTPASPSHFGQTLILPSVTLTSSSPGSPTPTGNVSMVEVIGGTDSPLAGLTNVAATSIANANLGFYAVGTHVFRIDYLGNANYAASSLTLTQVVDPAVTTATITSSSSGASPSGSAMAGADVTLTMTVSAASGGFPPIGTLQIRDNTTNTVLGTALPDSPATSGTNTRNYTLFVNAAQIAASGTHDLTAVYTSGSGNFANHTSAIFALNVIGPPTSTPTMTPTVTPSSTPTSTATPGTAAMMRAYLYLGRSNGNANGKLVVRTIVQDPGGTLPNNLIANAVTVTTRDADSSWSVRRTLTGCVQLTALRVACHPNPNLTAVFTRASETLTDWSMRLSVRAIADAETGPTTRGANPLAAPVFVDFQNGASFSIGQTSACSPKRHFALVCAPTNGPTR